MRHIHAGMLVATVIALLASPTLARQGTAEPPETTEPQHLECEPKAGVLICTLGRSKLDEFIDKAYQLGYRKGHEDGFDAAKPSSLSTRWVVPDENDPLGMKIILTPPGKIPSNRNAYPLPPGLGGR